MCCHTVVLLVFSDYPFVLAHTSCSIIPGTRNSSLGGVDLIVVSDSLRGYQPQRRPPLIHHNTACALTRMYLRILYIIKSWEQSDWVLFSVKLDRADNGGVGIALAIDADVGGQRLGGSDVASSNFRSFSCGSCPSWSFRQSSC